MSAGIANAAAQSCASAGGASTTPAFCQFTSNNENAAVTLQSVTFGDLTWNENNGALTPQAAGKAVSQLIFRFNEGGGNTPTGSASSPSAFIIKSNSTQWQQHIVLDGGTKGIEMGAQTDGTTGKLEVYFGQGVDANRQFHLNLSQSAGDFSFKGNIVVQAGKGNPGMTNRNSKFVGDFGKKVIGDIVVSNRSGGNQSGHKTELNFSSRADLQGSLTTKAGTTTATFADGNITGNVVVEDTVGEFSKSKNIITFNGQDNKIQGNVITVGGGFNSGLAHNIITFEQGGVIEGFVESKASTGNNQITFKGTTGTIKGNVLSSNSSQNNITMESTTSTIEGNVQAHAAGSSSVTSTNFITFKKSGATIKGSVSAEGNNYQNAKGVNTINFENGGTIKGEVRVKAGENRITFNGTGDATLESRVWGDFDGIHKNQKNTITMESSDTNTIKGGVHEQTANNVITMGGTTATIENGVKAIGNGFNNLDGNTTFGNEVTMKGTTSTIKGGISATEGRNIITFGETGTAVTSAAIDGDITADYSSAGWGSGKNTITLYADTATINGNVIAQGAGGSASNTIELKSGNLTINGRVSTSNGRTNTITTEANTNLIITGGLSGGGSNTISGAASKVTSNGSLTANAGTNNVKLDSGAFVMKSTTKAPISITSSGSYTASNNIAAESLEIEVSAIKVEVGGQGNNSNTIIGKSGSITAALISADRGTNNIGLGGGTAGSTASSLSANIIASNRGGNNIILEDATWLSLIYISEPTRPHD